MGVVGQSFAIIDTMPSPWNTIIKCLLVIAGLVYVSTRTIKFVPQGSLALKLRLGKVVYKNGVPVIRQPGLQLVWPFTHKLKVVSVLDYPVLLRNVTIPLSRYEVVRLRATVIFEIKDIYAVSYASEDFRAQLASACEAALRQSVQSTGGTDVELVEAMFESIVASQATDLGVAFKLLNITSIEPYGLAMIAEAIRKTPGDNPLEILGVSVNGKTQL